MGQLCSPEQTSANLRQVTGSQGRKEAVIFMEGRKNAINSMNHGIDVVMKYELYITRHTLKVLERREQPRKFYFDGQRGTGSNEVRMLSKGLKKFYALHTINLNFYLCREITDTGLKYLSEAIKSLPTLHSIHLNFHWCREITDIGLKYLSEAVKPFPTVHTINLKFGACEKVTDGGLKRLSEAIKSLPTLHVTNLNYDI